MAPGIPGGPQLKFLCLGNNTRVTEATGNMSEIPKELLGLTKTSKSLHFNTNRTLWKRAQVPQYVIQTFCQVNIK